MHELPGARPTADWTPRRRELLAWVQRELPTHAEAYEAAVVLLSRDDVPLRHRFIVLAIQEIISALQASVETRRLDYQDSLDRLSKRWRAAGLPTSLPGAQGAVGKTAAQETPIPWHLHESIRDLLSKHEEARARAKGGAERVFSRLPPQDLAPAAPILKQWKECADWFRRRYHVPREMDKLQLDVTDLKENVELFERTLLALIRGPERFYATVEELDAILADANS